MGEYSDLQEASMWDYKMDMRRALKKVVWMESMWGLYRVAVKELLKAEGTEPVKETRTVLIQVEITVCMRALR